MSTDIKKFAVVHNVMTTRKLECVCEYVTYDVWGNAKDGYEVNDCYSHGEITIPALMTVSNVPRLPGASDAFRSFPSDSNSFSCDACFSFIMTDKSIKKALGIKCKIEIGGDDRAYEISRERDGYPIGRLDIIRFQECE